MRRSAPALKTEPPSEAYAALFSIQYYDLMIEHFVATVLTYGRQLVGLDALPPGETMTASRIDDEFERAEPFVRRRVKRAGFGWLQLDLSEDEWAVIADSHQRTHRSPPSTGSSEYDRLKANRRRGVEIQMPPERSVRVERRRKATQGEVTMSGDRTLDRA